MDRSERIDTRGLLLFLARVSVVVLPPLFLASALFAAPKGPATPPPAAKKPAWTPPKAKAADAGGDAKETGPKETAAKADAALFTPKATDGGDNLVKESEHKEGDASVKSFEFGTTQIEGRAKWPAITYFVRRMRAEFDSAKLPHRPFIPELESSKGDPAVK
jgi:hypothetical protein